MVGRRFKNIKNQRNKIEKGATTNRSINNSKLGMVTSSTLHKASITLKVLGSLRRCLDGVGTDTDKITVFMFFWDQYLIRNEQRSILFILPQL